MVSRTTLQLGILLAIAIAASGCGTPKNYRDGTGVVRVETRAVDGVAK